MSNTPEPEMDLDLHFLPAWARQSPDINRYAHYEGGGQSDRRGGRRRFDGPRDRNRDDRPRQDRPRDDRPRGDQPPRRGGRPGERRGAAPRGRERGPVREALPPLPEVDVTFIPEARGVESLARQIKVAGRAYPVFEIAQLILSKPERYQVQFGVVKKPDGQVAQELWLCSIDNTLWLSVDEAVGHILRRHFEMFYEAEKTPTDPPKGTYTFVAQCGLSGTILGPPNYHDYQSKLRKLHASRFGRMSLEAYKAKVRIVRDEEVVKKWIEDQSFKTEYVCLNVPEPLKLSSRDEAEKHFREVHAGTVLRSVDSWTSAATVAQQLPNATMRQLLRRTWEDQRRFPLKVVTVLSQQLASHGLQFFKVNKTVTHVCVARPHYLDLEQSPVSDGVRRIVEYIQAHEGCSRRDLVETLAPTPTVPAEVKSSPEKPVEAEKAGGDTATSPEAGEAKGESAAVPAVEPTPTPEQTAVVGDLHWLIHQGHVIEFANGRLETAKKPKPKPEPKPKAPKRVVEAAKPAVVAEPSGEGAEPAAVPAETGDETQASAEAKVSPDPAVETAPEVLAVEPEPQVKPVAPVQAEPLDTAEPAEVGASGEEPASTEVEVKPPADPDETDRVRGGEGSSAGAAGESP